MVEILVQEGTKFERDILGEGVDAGVKLESMELLN
jgi:hypothetical protein